MNIKNIIKRCKNAIRALVGGNEEPIKRGRMERPKTLREVKTDIEISGPDTYEFIQGKLDQETEDYINNKIVMDAKDGYFGSAAFSTISYGEDHTLTLYTKRKEESLINHQKIKFFSGIADKTLSDEMNLFILSEEQTPGIEAYINNDALTILQDNGDKAPKVFALGYSR